MGEYKRSVLYYCDPSRNKTCDMKRCILYMGTCFVTDNPEHAELNETGSPRVVMPREVQEQKFLQRMLGR